MGILDIFTEDKIVDLLIKQVDELPYNDFGYLGLYDLDKEWESLDISNQEYYKLLLLKNNISKCFIDKTKNLLLVRKQLVNTKQLYKIYYDSEYNCYYTGINPEIDRILYYISLIDSKI